MLLKEIKSKRKVEIPVCTGPADVSDPLNTFLDNMISNLNDRKKVLYIHTPFCLEKCRYCKWQSSKGSYYDVREHFEKTLPEQLKKVERIFSQATFDEIYFGGGTPTMAFVETLEEFFNKIPNFKDIPNKCIEASPDTLDEEDIELFKKYNFNFLSVGIQTLDPRISMKQNRFITTHQDVVNIADYLKDTDIYLNFDMICFLDNGDIRDIPQFERDLEFLMRKAIPSSITIHQEHFAHQSIEKTSALMNMIIRKLSENPSWICVNTTLDPDNIRMDTMYRAEYKIAHEKFEYMHHLWDKYNLNLKNQYDVLSLGSTPKHPLSSFCGDLIYDHEKNLLFDGPWPEYDSEMFNQLHNFRIKSGYES